MRDGSGLKPDARIAVRRGLLRSSSPAAAIDDRRLWWRWRWRTTRSETAADTGSVQEDFTITFPFQDSIIWSGYEIAQGSDGPMEVDAGLRPETQAVEGNSQSIQQLIAGKVDYAITGAPEIFVANARGTEGDTASRRTTTTSSPWWPRTTPGRRRSRTSRGKSIGVTDLGGGEIPLVNAVLADAGLSPARTSS